jgi:hypothetical protein
VEGHGGQIALKSWWPLPSTWDYAGCNWGRWTPWNEVWFQKRLREIQEGTGQPLSANVWRDRLNGSKAARTLKVETEKLSLEFLRSI